MSHVTPGDELNDLVQYFWLQKYGPPRVHVTSTYHIIEVGYLSVLKFHNREFIR
jgi:hypothetical protein